MGSLTAPVLQRGKPRLKDFKGVLNHQARRGRGCVTSGPQEAPREPSALQAAPSAWGRSPRQGGEASGWALQPALVPGGGGGVGGAVQAEMTSRLAGTSGRSLIGS